MSKKGTNISKALAIILMMVYHVVNFYGWDQENPLRELFIPYARWQQFSIGGQICVSIFLFLTMYGITKQYHKKQLKTGDQITAYTIKRYFSLMFNYWVVFVLSLAVFHTKTDIIALYGENTIGNLLIDFLGLSTKFQTPSFNSTWWFMGMATLTVVFSPLMVLLVKKIGMIALPFAYFFAFWFAGSFADYFVVLIAGTCFAECEIFEKCKIKIKTKNIIKVLYHTMYIFLIFFMLYERDSIITDRNITNPILCCTIVLYVHLFLSSSTSYVSKFLDFVGNHSMNMFLIHTFIYYYYYSKFVYSFQYISLIIFVVFFISLGISVVLEMLKKILGVYALKEMVLSKIK